MSKCLLVVVVCGLAIFSISFHFLYGNRNETSIFRDLFVVHVLRLIHVGETRRDNPETLET